MFAVIKRKTIILTVSAMLAMAILIPIVSYSGAYMVYAGKTTRKLPIYCVETAQPIVAISFDASWGCESTEKILDVVTAHGIKANFFAVSLWVEKYPELLKKLHSSGVFEIGMHSATHPHMSKLSISQIKEEIISNQNAIESIIGVKPDLFRAPFGEYTNSLLETTENMNIYTIQWDVDSLDWKGISAGEIVRRVVSNTHAGSIILMHNDGKHTAEALPAIIEGILNKGLKFVTIGEMIYRDNYTIDHTGKQIKNNK